MSLIYPGSWVRIWRHENTDSGRIFHHRAKRHESELDAAHHRDGVDRLCERLLGDGRRRRTHYS
jgi:hypothetical protein